MDMQEARKSFGWQTDNPMTSPYDLYLSSGTLPVPASATWSATLDDLRRFLRLPSGDTTAATGRNPRQFDYYSSNARGSFGDYRMPVTSPASANVGRGNGRKGRGFVTCVQCERAFADIPTLMEHVDSHFAVKTYLCIHCYDCFADDLDLSVHLCPYAPRSSPK